MKHDVFISYSTEDKTIADAVCHTLEGKKIRCWIAPRDIVPGVEWSEAIVYGIRGSYVMVLVFSSHANNSPQVKREVQMAFESAIPVIPLRVENVKPGEGLGYYLGPIHYLDALAPPLEKHLRQLADSVKALLENAGTGRPGGQKEEFVRSGSAGAVWPEPVSSQGAERTGAEVPAFFSKPLSWQHQVWMLTYEGHQIHVENEWNFSGLLRARLYIDLKLADEREGDAISSVLSGTLIKGDGMKVGVRAEISQGLLGLSLKCQIWTDGIFRTPQKLDRLER
jgi:hypothetical protein